MSVFTEQEVVLIRRTYDAHAKIRGVIEAITNHIGKKRYAVWCICKRVTWKSLTDEAYPDIKPIPLDTLKRHFKKWPTGDAHKLTKISDLQVREIRYFAQQNAGRVGLFPTLAKRYGVSRSLIRQICNRKKRTEAPDRFDELGELDPLYP